MVGHFLALFSRNFSLRLKIDLVSDQNPSGIVLVEFLNFTHPSVNCIERVSVGDVIGDDDAVSSLVVA